jgi:hypothetical protein
MDVPEQPLAKSLANSEQVLGVTSKLKIRDKI